MDKSQHLEEIKSTAENCYNIGYKRGYEAAIEYGRLLSPRRILSDRYLIIVQL